MAYKKKTWKEKLEDNKGFPKTIDYSTNLPCARALKKLGAKPGDSVVLAPAIEVYEIMSKLPEGKLITLNEICEIVKYLVEIFLWPPVRTCSNIPKPLSVVNTFLPVFARSLPSLLQ